MTDTLSPEARAVLSAALVLTAARDRWNKTVLPSEIIPVGEALFSARDDLETASRAYAASERASPAKERSR